MRYFFLSFLILISVWSAHGNLLYGQEKSRLDSTIIQSSIDSTIIQFQVDSVITQPQSDSLSIPQRMVKKRATQNYSWKINRKELNGLVVQDMSDIAQIIPATSTFNFGSPGQNNPLIFRGGKPQQSKIVIDGLVVEDIISGNLNSTALPFHVTDTLNFQSGSSLLSGETADALFLKTKRISGTLPFSTVRYGIGDWNYSDLNIIFALPLSQKSNLLISAARQKFGGFSGEARDVGNSRFWGAFQRRLKKNLDLKFVGLLNKNKAVIPSLIAPDFIQSVGSPLKKENRLDSQLALKYTNLTASYELDVKISISKVHQESFDNNIILFDNHSTVSGLVLQNTFRRNKFEYRFGGETKLTRVSSEQIPDLKDDFKRGFIGLNFNLTEKINVDFLSGLEKHKGYKTEFNPGFILNYNFTNISRFWASVKKYSRYPTYVERFWTLPFYLGNNELRPEQIRSIELGFKATVKKDIVLESAVFYKSIHNWIESGIDAPNQTFTFRNIGDYNITGLDLKSTWKYFNAGNLGLTASFLNFGSSQPVVPNSPELVMHAYLEAGLPLFQNYVFPILRLSGRFYGSRNGWRHTGISTPNVIGLPSVSVLDAHLKLLFAGASVTVAYKNLLDRDYELMPGFAMPPRSLIFGIDWEFWD